MATTQRIVLLLTQVAWVLPFAVVTECGTTERRTVMGWAVYDKLDERLVFMGIPLVVALVLGVWAWRRSERVRDGAAGLGLRAVAAGLALATAVIGPGLAHLFDQTTPHLGWSLQLAGWGTLYVGYLGGAAWALSERWDGGESAPEGIWGAGAVLMAPLFSAALAALLQRNAWPGILGAGALWGLPLALAVLGVGRRAQAGQAGRWRTGMTVAVLLWVLICASMALE